MATCQLVACLPENHPLAEKQSISLSDMQDADLIMLKKGSFLRHRLQQKFKAASITPNVVLESNQIETIKGLVKNGVGIAFLLDFIVADTPGIKTLPLNEPVFVDIGLAWKKDRYISKAAQAFIDFCKDTLIHQKKNKA